jgi:hypothetical protein
VLAPIIESMIPKVPPTPGNPNLTLPQDMSIILQGRGTGKERPLNEGDFSPDHPVLKDVNPVELDDVGDSSTDGGDDAGTEAAELEEALAAKLPPPKKPPPLLAPREQKPLAGLVEKVKEPTWGINDLRENWTPADLAAAAAAGHPKDAKDELVPVDRGKSRSGAKRKK